MEIKRIFNRNLIFAIAVIALFNYVFFIKQQFDDNAVFYENNQYSYFEYNDLCNDFYKELQGTDRNEWKKQINELYFYIKDTSAGKASIAKQVAKGLYEQINYINTYESVLDEKIMQAEIMVNTALYNNPESFGYHNLLKTRYDMKRLYNLNLKVSPSAAIDKFFEYKLTKYLLLFIMLLTVVSIKASDSNMQHLILTTPNGRKVLAVKRCGILFGAGILYAIVLYIPMLITSFLMYGGKESLNELIQSNSLNQFSMLIVTNGMYLFLFILFQGIGVFIAGMVFWTVLSVISGEGIGLGLISVIIIAEFILYAVVVNHPIFYLLRWCNIFAFVDWHVIMSGYMNIGFNTHIVQRFAFVLGAMLVCFLIFACVHLLFGINNKSGDRRNILKGGILSVLWSLRKKIAAVNNFFKELYKILIIQKGLPVLLIFLIYLLNYDVGIGQLYKEDFEFIVLDYYKSVNGDAYTASDTYIKELEDKIRIFEDNAKEASDKREYEMAIDNHQKALAAIKQQVQTVRGLNADGISASIVNVSVIENRYNRVNACYTNLALAILVTLFCIFYKTFSIEQSTNMQAIVGPSEKQGRFMVQKYLAVSGITVAIVGFVSIFMNNQIQIRYPLNGYEAEAAIQSVPMFADFPFAMSFKTLDFLIVIGHIVVFLMISYLVVAFSLLKNKVYFLIGFAIIFPYLFKYFGFDVFPAFSVISYATLIELYKECNSVALIIAGWLVFILTGVVSVILVRKKWRYL